jgi:hypothetical protein
VDVTILCVDGGTDSREGRMAPFRRTAAWLGTGRWIRGEPIVPAAPGVQPPTAQQVIMQLTQRGPMVNMRIVYAAEMEPKKLLGGPGGYLSKSSFTDSKISTVRDSTSFGKDVYLGSVQLGEVADVFPNTQGARERVIFTRSVASGCQW